MNIDFRSEQNPAGNVDDLKPSKPMAHTTELQEKVLKIDEQIRQLESINWESSDILKNKDSIALISKFSDSFINPDEDITESTLQSLHEKANKVFDVLKKEKKKLQEEIENIQINEEEVPEPDESSLLKPLIEAGADELVEVIREALEEVDDEEERIDILKHSLTLITTEMSDDEVFAIVQRIGEIDSSRRGKVTEGVRLLANKISSSEVSFLIPVVTKLDTEKLHDFIEQVSLLFTEPMEEQECTRVLKALLAADYDTRADSITTALQAKGLSRCEMSYLVYALAKIGSMRKEFVDKTFPFFLEMMRDSSLALKDYELTSALDYLTDVDTESREAFLKNVLDFASNEMSGHRVLDIMHALDGIKKDEWDDVASLKGIAFSYANAVKEKSLRGQCNILKDFLALSREEKMHLIKEPEVPLLFLKLSGLPQLDVADFVMIFRLLPGDLKTQQKLSTLDSKLFEIPEYQTALTHSLADTCSVTEQFQCISFIKRNALLPETLFVSSFVERLAKRAATDEVAKAITVRYGQMATTSELETLPPLEKLHLAYFIESQVPKVDLLARSTFRKKEWGLSHSLLIESGNVYVKNIKLLGTGGYKKVTAALSLPLLQNAHTAQLVAIAVSKEGETLADHKISVKEMVIHQLLKDVPGIWPMHFWFHYPAKSDQTLEKILSVMDIADGDLHRFSYPDSDLTFSDELSMSQDLILGLYFMHLKHYAHGDLKLINALFKMNEKGEYKAGLIDFGFSFNTETDDPTHVYRQGFYGSIGCTAPELFGNKNFTGDYFKLDVWALGTMLYQLHFKQSSPWENHLSSFYDDKTNTYKPVSDQDKAYVNESVKKSIEEPLAKLEQKSSLSKTELFECLIYKMMRLDPTERLDMDAVRAEIEKIILS